MHKAACTCNHLLGKRGLELAALNGPARPPFNYCTVHFDTQPSGNNPVRSRNAEYTREIGTVGTDPDPGPASCMPRYNAELTLKISSSI
jgi:hypothetical protein